MWVMRREMLWVRYIGAHSTRMFSSYFLSRDEPIAFHASQTVVGKVLLYCVSCCWLCAEAKTKLEMLIHMQVAVHHGLYSQSDKHLNIFVFHLIKWVIVCCLGLQLLTGFIWRIVWSLKCQKIVKNPHYNYKSKVTTSNVLFYPTNNPKPKYVRFKMK